jgi:hypothetical protein
MCRMANRMQLQLSDLHPEVVPLDSLRPYAKNPRAHDQELIERSLVLHGMYRPLVVATDDVILAGNGTYAAIASLRDQPVVHWANLLHPGWTDMPEDARPSLPSQEEWIQRWSSAAITRLPIPSTDPQAAEILMVDNRANDVARNDDGLLAQLLAEVAGAQGDTIATGYDARAVEKLLASLNGDGPPGEFPHVGHDLPFTYQCPCPCAYRWSGSPRPKNGTSYSEEDDVQSVPARA